VAGRRESIEKASAIVNSAVHEFVRAHRVRVLGPMIEQLYRRYHAVAQEELNRTLQKLPNATDAEKEHLQDLTRRIVNKLLNEPVQALRRADDTHPAGGDQYAHAMQHLFRLSEAMPATETNENEEAEPSSNE
jgi:glutamyl-tRNA reductase